MKLNLPDPAATTELGAALARALAARPGLVLYLSGDLGAGKTTLVRGLLRTLGVEGTVRSPTYTLLEPYETESRLVIHVDMYRLRGADELENLGLQDYPPESTWWLVEWPERGAGRLPPPDLEVGLQVRGEGREATVRPAAGLPLNYGRLAEVSPELAESRSKVLLEE